MQLYSVSGLFSAVRILVATLCCGGSLSAFAQEEQEPLPLASVDTVIWQCGFGVSNQEMGILCINDSADVTEALTSDLMIIPLYSPPVDPAMAALLAQSVMCRGNVNCRAFYGASQP